MDEEKILSYFKIISSIPRASHDEKAVSDYIADFACKRGLDVLQDESYNLIVQKPAYLPSCTASSLDVSPSPNTSPVILQCHLDMVFVTEDEDAHPYKDGIHIQDDGECLFAEGTSLGADNGIAIAFCLALLDSQTLMHPPLEIIFTVKEEVGLAGAAAIDLSSLSGTRFINLDSEEEGVFYTSCAGGLRGRLSWHLKKEAVSEELCPLDVTLGGLTGGHSGINIGTGGGNAIELIGRLLHMLRDSISFYIGNIHIPGKTNAIPAEGHFRLYVRPQDREAAVAELKKAERIFQDELSGTDKPVIRIGQPPSVHQADVYSEELKKAVVDTLLLLPCGVFGYSHSVPGLVETSSSLGLLTEEQDMLTLQLFLRSSVDSRKYMLRKKVQVIAGRYCDFCTFENDYPGWKYRKDSPLRATAMELYETLYQKTPSEIAIHAGLECGYWAYKLPDADIISIGPDLYDVHTTRERVSKQSVFSVWNFLTRLLEELS